MCGRLRRILFGIAGQSFAPALALAIASAMLGLEDWERLLVTLALATTALIVLDAIGGIRLVTGAVRRRLRRVAKSGEQFATSAADVSVMGILLSRSAGSLSSSAQNVASASEQIAASLQTMEAAAHEISAHARSTADAVREAGDRSQSIGKDNHGSQLATANAARMAQASRERIGKLDAAATNIANVVSMIGSVALQTRLLALNASVEAARAGDAGRGFAVVAEEVRTLAGRSAEAAEQIRGSVEQIQGLTTETVDWIRQVADAIAEVEQLAGKVGAAIEQQVVTMHTLGSEVERTAAGVTEVTTGITELSAAGQEIALSVATVNDAVGVLATQATDARSVGGSMTAVTQTFYQGLSAMGIGKHQTIDIAAIKAAHNNWKIRLGALIDGKASIDPAEVTSDHDCSFGKWYYGPGQRLRGRCEAFDALAEPHARVHRAALHCTQRMRAGDEDGAVHAYGELKTASAQLFELLDVVDAECNR